jgi:hypothetical protein
MVLVETGGEVLNLGAVEEAILSKFFAKND